MTDVVCFGEVLLRLSAAEGRRLMDVPHLDAGFGGAEANVAVALAHLGYAAEMVTTLPENSLGSGALEDLRRHGVGVDAIRRRPGRLGLYFHTPGAMLRAATVEYDRAGSAFAVTDAESYDWAAILRDTAVLHVGGITPALGVEATRALTMAVETARRAGVTVSVDLNFRPSLWSGRLQEARVALRTLASQADVLFAGAQDAAFLLDENCESGTAEAQAEVAGRSFFAVCPHLQQLASTHREVLGTDHHRLRGFLVERDGTAWSRTWELNPIVERIGGGDAFAAGILSARLERENRTSAIEFATALAALKHTLPGDASTATRAQTQQLLAGAGRQDVGR